MASSSEQQRKPETFHLSAEAQEALPPQAQMALAQVDNLKYFLISAPVDWAQDQYIRRFLLPTGEYVSCVIWGSLFHITGTDIVRCLAFRFEAFGRPVKNPKKFEEGIFSDLRNLKAGNDASLEEPKSPFLDFLYKNNCIRTQKKQKVFYWYSVPHDRLFLDALERDLKREKAGLEPTTESQREPSLSFVYDPSRSLYEQLTKPDDVSETSDEPHGRSSHSPSRSVSVARASCTVPALPPTSQTVSFDANYMPDNVLNDNMTNSQNRSGSTHMAKPMMNPTSTNRTTTGKTKNDHVYHQNTTSYGTTQVPYHCEQQQHPYMARRHNSVPQYYHESSPAPSFASAHSYYDDHSRAVSYEPITPPQYPYGYPPEYTYHAEANTNHLTSSYDGQLSFTTPQAYSMSMPPPPPPRFNSVPRQLPSASAFTHIEGSPLYKQRRRGSSLVNSNSHGITYGQSPPPQTQHTRAVTPHATRRPSNLQRSVSASVLPQGQVYQRAGSGPPAGSAAYMNELRHTPDSSRHYSSAASSMDNHYHSHYNKQSTPTPAVETMQMPYPQSMPGVMRRARSNTMPEVSPYPTKSYACPAPECGRNFKRSEHLKRHVRTHTQEKPYQCNQCDKAFSRSDNLAQHRRTHEPQEGFLEHDEEQESDSCAGLTEDVDSPESIGTAAFGGSQCSTMEHQPQYLDDFNTYTNYGDENPCGQSTELFAESMGPPAIPMNQGFM